MRNRKPTRAQIAALNITRPLFDLKGRDPKEFNRAMHFIGPFEEYARELGEMDHDRILPILTARERAEVRKHLAEIRQVHNDIMRRLA